MKNLKHLLILSGLLLTASLSFGQTLLTTTTLSAAVQGMGSVNGATPTGNMSIVSLTSATGVNAPSPNTGLLSGQIATGGAQTFLYIDRELMEVKAVSGTIITVIRGAGSTSAPSHASGAVVFIIPTSALGAWSGGGYYGGAPSVPQGSCTRTNELYLPRIQFTSGEISDCVGGQWVTGDALSTTRNSGTVLYAPQPGGTAYTSLNTNGTTLAATTMYCTEIQMPFAKYTTGLEVLNGTTVGTDNHLVVLYDATGNLIANSAVAGVLAATASEYQKIAFTTPYYLVGPAQYFGCLQTNGTTATVRMLVTAVQDNYLTKGVTAQTFGTIPATITVPTTFTTAVGPYLALY
jgi:hypothetical protein